MHYTFGKDTERLIGTVESSLPPRSSNSLFTPAKEVLSGFDVIRASRERDNVFGFDDTYYDLVSALALPRQKGRNFEAFAATREKLEEIIGGKAELDPAGTKWSFRRGPRKEQVYPITATAEGHKKLAILDTLLGNRYLDTDSVLFLDEPESALHPKLVTELAEMLTLLSKGGMQFFLATHSYFVIKALRIVAVREDMSIPILMLGPDGPRIENLRDDIPPNEIVDESIRLYEQEVLGDL